MKHEEKKVIIEPDFGEFSEFELIKEANKLIDRAELIKEANKLIDRAEQIIRDLVEAIKLKPAGGLNCSKV